LTGQSEKKKWEKGGEGELKNASGNGRKGKPAYGRQSAKKKSIATKAKGKAKGEGTKRFTIAKR